MIPRAERFPMRIPLAYRATGDSEWLSGTTANISASGVLFVADSILEPGAPVEMRLVFPGRTADVPHGRVMCHGRIVRVQPLASAEGRSALAATIANYRLLKADEPSHA